MLTPSGSGCHGSHSPIFEQPEGGSQSPIPRTSGVGGMQVRTSLPASEHPKGFPRSSGTPVTEKTP